MFDFLSIHIGFLEIRILDVVDILLVSILLFYIYKLLKGSIAFNIFIGVAFLYLIWYLVKLLDMNMLSRILGQFIELGVLAFLILFQPEIRRFLLLVGKGRKVARSQIFKRFIQQREFDYTSTIDAMYNALQSMKSDKTGALIVVSRDTQLQFVCDTGTTLNAEISCKLLESIFEKNAALHDGAVIIAGNKILAASCTLPLSESRNLPKRAGTRHRAALGISEISDALVFLVSEETGKISVAEGGELYYEINDKELKDKLRNAFTTEL